MRDISYFNKICLCLDRVDFRNQANGLLAIIKGSLGKHPLETRSIFAFTNKRKNAVKLLYWDLSGFALWQKSLEKEKFKWPKSKEGKSIMISPKELKWLLQGIDLSKLKPHETLNYDDVF